MLRGANMNLYLHLKWFFLECCQTSDFTTSTLANTRKCLSYSGLCRPISAILRMLNGCSVLVARKLLQSVTNEPDELKL